jgi:hypothetical protein
MYACNLTHSYTGLHIEQDEEYEMKRHGEGGEWEGNAERMNSDSRGRSRKKKQNMKKRTTWKG